MKEVELPGVREGNWRGVLVEQQQLAGRDLWAVTVRDGRGPGAARRWFDAGSPALAYAAGQADTLSLPLFDLCDPSPE